MAEKRYSMTSPNVARSNWAAAFAADRARWVSVGLAVLGALDSLYLTYIKYANAPAFCSGVGDCESVNNSVYSQVAGVPIALFGLGAYLLIALLLPIFAGCATGGDTFSGINKPVDIQCTGKGAITGSGSVNAGVGETVLIVSGSSARMASGLKDSPVDAAIIGVVDQVEVKG